jgi:hypothetical protein
MGLATHMVEIKNLFVSVVKYGGKDLLRLR